MTAVQPGTFRRATPFFSLIVALSTPLMRGVFRLRSRGLENVPGEGGFVVASNHVSNLDPWPLGFPLYPRQIHYMAKAELYRNPVLRWVLDKGGSFPVRRGQRDVRSWRTAIRLAQEGGVVAMFPEGTRRAKGLRKRHQAHPHPGAARLALRAGVPLVPAAIVGTNDLRRLRPLRIAYGPPIHIVRENGTTRRETARVATERLMAEIARLERELEAS